MNGVRALSPESAPINDAEQLLFKLRAVKARLDEGDTSAIAEAEALLREAQSTIAPLQG